MSRIYEGKWRALMRLDGGNGVTIMMHTEPPDDYEEVEKYLWDVGMKGLPVEGMRVMGSLMIRVSEVE